MRAMRVLRAPAFYVVWALFVIVGLLSAYWIDPYIFGLFSLGSAWATGVVTLSGLVAVVFSRRSQAHAKLVVGSALLVAAVAVAIALRVLGGFHWG